MRITRRSTLIGAGLLWVAGVSAPARAHFILLAPDSWMTQDAQGLPEKLGPCGNEGGGTPTGTVTAFRAGQTIAVTIDEVIMHPGHYRVALAVDDRSELPAEPAVTPTAGDPCGSVDIQNPPTFPILADGELPHTQAFTAPQTFAVTLPTDITCSKCTLQVLEFMSHHGAPCFYHHCADISIQAAAPPTSTESPPPTNTQPPSPTPSPEPTSTAFATPSAVPTSTPSSTPPRCVGDCDDDGSISIDELVRCVRIVGDSGFASCPAFDSSSQREPAIEELVAAVNNALDGCRTRQ